MKRTRRKQRSHWMRLGSAMLPTTLSVDERKRLRNRLLASVALLLAVWLTFFDSHSLLKRVRWHAEVGDLNAENEELRREIDQLEQEVAKGLSDEAAEKIAREEYGMRRPGETVYPVEVEE